MLSSKIRSTTIALIAASSFAATAVVPAVSQASRVNPYRSAQAKQAAHKQVVGGICSETLESLNEDLRLLEKAHKEENTKEIEKWRTSANADYKFGYELGCGFTK
jgi:TolA-binding protein